MDPQLTILEPWMGAMQTLFTWRDDPSEDIDLDRLRTALNYAWSAMIAGVKPPTSERPANDQRKGLLSTGARKQRLGKP